MPIHKVAEGEDIVSLAAPTGVPWKKVWASPENDALRRKRKSPHLLAAGDEVFLPELETKFESAESEKTNRFQVKGEPARFRARLFERKAPEDEKREQSAKSPSEYVEEETARKELPFANTPYQLYVDGVPENKGTTDGDGYVDVELPPHAREGLLVLSPGDAEKERRVELQWRHLEPIEELTGVCQRLTNLGFPCPSRAEAVTPQIEAAVVAFQKQQGLDPTGSVDAQLRDKLVTVHGS